MAGRKLIATMAAGAVLLVCAAGSATAQDYPSKPVKIIVPFLAGGPNDVVGRLVAQQLGEELKGSFIVENVAGAGGRLGIGNLAKSAPDGYTLAITANAPMAIVPHLFEKIPYDPLKSFVHVAMVANGTLTISTNPKVPAKTLGELIALAKSKPGELAYGSPGIGSLPHLAAEMFQAATGAKLRHVPYRGGSAVTQDLLAGHIQLSFEAPLAAAGLHQKGVMRMLAVLDDERFKAAPDVPTAAEAGVKGVEINFWTGVLAPAGTPPPITSRIATAIDAMLKKPAVIEALARQGMKPFYRDSAAFRDRISAETKTWGDVIRRAGIKKQ